MGLKILWSFSCPLQLLTPQKGIAIEIFILTFSFPLWPYILPFLSHLLSLSLSLPPRDNQGRTAADIACLKCSTGSEQLKSRIRDLINSETIFRVYCLKERA